MICPGCGVEASAVLCAACADEEVKRLTLQIDDLKDRHGKRLNLCRYCLTTVWEREQRAADGNSEEWFHPACKATKARDDALRLNGELKGRLSEIEHVATLFWNGKPDSPLGLILDVCLRQTEKPKCACGTDTFVLALHKPDCALKRIEANEEAKLARKARCVEKCQHPADFVCDYEDGTSHCLECVAEKFWQIEDILSGKHNVHTYWGALETIAHPERYLTKYDPIEIAKGALSEKRNERPWKCAHCGSRRMGTELHEGFAHCLDCCNNTKVE